MNCHNGWHLNLISLYLWWSNKRWWQQQEQQHDKVTIKKKRKSTRKKIECYYNDNHNNAWVCLVAQFTHAIFHSNYTVRQSWTDKKNDKFPPIKQGKKRNFMSSFFTLLYFKYVDTNLCLNQRHFQCLWISGQPHVSTNGPSESSKGPPLSTKGLSGFMKGVYWVV